MLMVAPQEGQAASFIPSFLSNNDCDGVLDWQGLYNQ